MAVYLSFAERMAIDALRDRNVYAALLLGFNQSDSQRTWSDVSALEVSGSGYPSGGVPVVLDVAVIDGEVEVQVGQINFGLLGVSSADAVVFYDKTGNPATSRLLAADDFGNPVAISGQQFTYTAGGWNLAILETVID